MRKLTVTCWRSSLGQCCTQVSKHVFRETQHIPTLQKYQDFLHVKMLMNCLNSWAYMLHCFFLMFWNHFHCIARSTHIFYFQMLVSVLFCTIYMDHRSSTHSCNYSKLHVYNCCRTLLPVQLEPQTNSQIYVHEQQFPKPIVR